MRLDFTKLCKETARKCAPEHLPSTLTSNNTYKSEADLICAITWSGSTGNGSLCEGHLGHVDTSLSILLVL